MVLSPHLSAFLIAAIKVPAPFPPRATPENPVCAAVHPGCAWSSGGGLKAHRFGSPLAENPDRRRIGTASESGSVGTSPIREQKKKEIDSSRRKRGLLSTVSPPLPRPPQSRVLSLKVSSGSIYHSISCSFPFSLLEYYICSKDNCTNSLCVRIVQLGSSYDIFAVFFDSAIFDFQSLKHHFSPIQRFYGSPVHFAF